MNALELAIQNAIASQGATSEANKAYLEFIKANFIMPIERNTKSDEPIALYLEENSQIFLPVFSNMAYFDAWAADVKEDIQLLKLSAVDLLKGIGEQVIVCLNIGSDLYKEFNASE